MNFRWLTNPWFVGIVGGIPSGLLVNWVTGLVLGKRENREYLQKINGANRDIVYAIRPGISEGEVPAADVLSSLINATARRYGVEASNLYSSTQIAEELVKEVMDSSFISSAQKAEYCGRLAVLGNSTKFVDDADPAKDVQPRAAAEYRQRLISITSMMLGVTTMLMTLSYALFDSLRNKRLFTIQGDEHAKFLLPMAATLATMTVSLLAVTSYRDLLRRKRRAEERKLFAPRFEVRQRPIRKTRPPEA